MKRDILIADRILEDMTDGVMTIAPDGRIITYNPAAAAILGISRDAALTGTFGELFLLAEENDVFNQTILDAIYEATVSHNRIVPYHGGGRHLTLSLTTTFLTAGDGSNENAGIIAVFNDITELQALQEAEQRLSGELQSKHRELQDAYLKAEESNRTLQAALKKVQVIRIAATAFTILLFVGIGLISWKKVPRSAGRPPAPAVPAGAGAPATASLTPQPVAATINLTGKFQPREMVNIASPLSGKVSLLHVRYGDVVTAGQPLVTMDTTEAQVKLREATAAQIKALAAYRQIDAWAQGAEMARAKRSLVKAKMALENQKKTLDETERLFKKGIIPATEYESAKHQYANQLLDFQSAEDEERAAAEKGGSEQRRIARFELENAESRLKQLQAELAGAVVVAPVSGIVMKPLAAKGKDGRLVERGASFQQGETLLAVGDLTGFAVECRVDEVDVTRVRSGQKVRVSAEALPGVGLEGVIRGVSPHAEEGDSRGGAPSFGVTVVVENIPPELVKRIFVGMSAALEIMVYENRAALMAPLAAVITEGGKRYVMVKTGNGPPRKTPVTTGYTTLDTVELLSGVKAGDVIEVGGEAPPKGGAADEKKK